MHRDGRALPSPSEDWARLVSLLKPGSWLGIMTQWLISRERFVRWQYKNDPTHVVFYSEDCLRWLARHFTLAFVRVDRDVILLRAISCA